MADKTFENHFYARQLANHILQFMAVLSGLQIEVGENDNLGESRLVDVPVRYGSGDRVVEHILSENTGNKMVRLPVIAVAISALESSSEDRSGVDQVHRRAHMPYGGSFPDDVRVVYQRKNTRIKVGLTAYIVASNVDSLLQLAEQILLVFNPTIEIQTTDDALNSAKIAHISLESINWEEQSFPGTEKRLVQLPMNFSFVAPLSAPINIKDNFIKSAQMRIAAIGTDEDICIVQDVDRPTPEYQKLFDIDDYSDLPTL